MKMQYNFHAHTWRCRHATGTERECIEAALASGITEMGFSDHAPWRYPDSTEPSYTVPYESVADYVNTVCALKAEYQGKITLHLGFEAEHFPADPEELIGFGAEYLILGQHFFKTDADRWVWAGSQGIESQLSRYVDATVRGIRSGYYTYVAHPDVFRYDHGDALVYEREMRRICEASAETGVPLEINFLGLRAGRYYPNPVFWRMAGEVGAPVTFGLDAHSASEAGDTASLPAAMALVEKYRLRYIGKPKLVLL